mgnify:CR=1 FL=1
MNGGKDVKIGHDKRPVSVVPSDEQPLYNISNGELLTDEFGNPLVTEVDQYFLADASAKRSTSVVFPSRPKESETRRLLRTVGIQTGTYGVNLEVSVVVTNVGYGTDKHALIVKQFGGGIVGVGTTTPGQVHIATPTTTTSGVVTLPNFPNAVYVRVIADQGGDKKYIYFSEDKILNIANVDAGDKVVGHGIPSGTIVTHKSPDRVVLSNNVVVSGITSERVEFIDVQEAVISNVDNVLKVAEVFQETSEVSTTLLGVNRAETQLSLFSNVSSYGLNSDEWESFRFDDGTSFRSWDRRINELYGNRYLSRTSERTVESAIILEAFPPSHSYPFGPKFEKIGLYQPDLYLQYLNFIRYGNDLYKLFSEKLSGYSTEWLDKFLNPADVTPFGDGSAVEVFYRKISTNPDSDPSPDVGGDYDYAFSKIDKWTDTYRDIARGSNLQDPITGEFLSFANLKLRLGSSSIGTGEVIRNIFDSGNTRPGYFTDYRRYSVLQSRRVFRYQPGRISGFTFGSRASTEPVSGMTNEWGIANKTDQYMFKIYAGQLSIVRRSTIPLENSVLIRNGLDPTTTLSVNIDGTSYNTVQPEIPSGDPFDVDSTGEATKYWTLDIPRDKFNGDPLNGNGPSGYTIRPEKVTMWKIEFGWYGAIGARFYAYIPAGAGEARWIVVHTLVIENSLGQPCLQDSYFRFKYQVNISNTASIRTPQYIYKYGASYYIDGGDEGTSEQFSTTTGLAPKQINRTTESPLIGIRPKDFITNSTGVEIANRKLIIPTKMSMSSDSLTEIKVKTCKACPGYGHVFTPGVKTTISGRTMNISFADGNTIDTVGSDSYFTENDIGAKIIAPSLFNAYITSVSGDPGGAQYAGPRRYTSAKIYGWGKGLDNYPDISLERQIGGTNSVIDYAVTNTLTGVSGSEVAAVGTGAYPHEIRLSNYDVHFASKYPIYGSKIEIQFINPRNRDGITSYRGDTHWADFMIGLTDKQPTIGGNSLNGWDSTVLPWTDYQGIGDNGGSPAIGVGLTTILPDTEILFGESTHTWAGMNEDGYEYAEAWAPTDIQVRMGIDTRVPTVPNPGGGRCSRATFQIASPTAINEKGATQIQSSNPENLSITNDSSGIYYLRVEGIFDATITDWVGGEVVYRDPNDPNNYVITGTGANTVKYQLTNRPAGSPHASSSDNPRAPLSFTDSGVTYSYIKISGDIGQTSDITVMGRPVTLSARRLSGKNPLTGIKSKLFKFDPFPLYLVGKLMDNSAINNISIKETIGEDQLTTSPELAITSGSVGQIDNASGNAVTDGTPPTNFKSVKRLSSSAVDTQNERKLRVQNTVTKDIFYLGANSTQEIDMSKIFGADRNVITPDNLNLEATFITAKKLDGDSSNNTGSVQLTLNYKEQ